MPMEVIERSGKRRRVCGECRRAEPRVKVRAGREVCEECEGLMIGEAEMDWGNLSSADIRGLIKAAQESNEERYRRMGIA
jgi:hypothetical protein